jgi:hypothetical protein
MPPTAQENFAYWDDQLTTMIRTQLTTVQQAATGWRTLFGALLGIFTSVAFAGGITTIDKLASPWSDVVKYGTLAAVLAAALATFWSNQASQSLSPEVTSHLDANYLRTQTNEQAATSLKRLNRAKISGALAIGVVLVGSALVLLVGPAASPSTSALATVNGKTICGVLKTTGSSLKLGSTALSGDVSDITLVPSCPKKPQSAAKTHSPTSTSTSSLNSGLLNPTGVAQLFIR